MLLLNLFFSSFIMIHCNDGFYFQTVKDTNHKATTCLQHFLRSPHHRQVYCFYKNRLCSLFIHIKGGFSDTKDLGLCLYLQAVIITEAMFGTISD